MSDPALKQQFVTPMFDIIASRYDEFTRVFSFGLDRRWKAQLLAELSPYVGDKTEALDLACGTGDLAFALAAKGARVTGIDASPRMIDEAKRRSSSVNFVVGDMTALDVPDRSVDVVTAGYALRNVPDYHRALQEIARVLRPGGRLLTLDFYRPENIIWRRAFLAYLSAAGNIVGWLWHREPVVYGYIAHSVDHYISATDFNNALNQTGFTVEQVHRELLGGIAIHHALFA
ncbi:MAG TPA: ubiquinone/menaquinone biosynthesis methyltransferase [Gemmatimonadaceae bacterium]|nr:ubiquinone/menaquinone biosynthesis methyltransferase [Gemmatimonadaceae bacterium]